MEAWKGIMTLNEKLGLRFRSTPDIIDAAEAGLLPDKIMITVHPQRWADSFLPWARELVWQNCKNQVKKYVVRSRQRAEIRGQSSEVGRQNSETRSQRDKETGRLKKGKMEGWKKSQVRCQKTENRYQRTNRQRDKETGKLRD